MTSRTIPGFGPVDAKIVIVGESPGQEEETSGLPFTGSGGKFLNAILSKIGINRHECYFTYLHKTRLPSNDFSFLYLDGAKKTTPSPSLCNSITNLHTELRGMRPNVIIPLGGETLRAIANKRSIDSWRGSIIPSPFGKVVGTYHPTRLLREYSLLPIATHDLARAREQSLFPEIKPLGLQLEINPSFDRVGEFLRSILTTPRPIVFDIETTRGADAQHPHVRCLGIADSPTHALCIPFFSSSRRSAPQGTIFLGPLSGEELNNHWTLEEEYEILSLLSRIFEDPRIEKCAQNAPFDTQVLFREFGFIIRGFVFDTMAGAYCLYPELPKGLDFLASLYTEIPYYSDYDASVDEELWTYNLFDCVATFQIWRRLEKELGDRKAIPQGLIQENQERLAGVELGITSPPFTSLDFYSHHLHPAVATMCRIGQRGVLIDQKVRSELRSKYETESIPFLHRFQTLAGSEVNPRSPQQLKVLFYDTLKLPPQYKPGPDRKITTDEDAIEALVKKAPEHVELFNFLLHYKKRQKLIGTYLDCTLTSNGRMVTSYNAVGTVGGRCNSSETVFGEGSNLQNIPNRPWIDLLGTPYDLGKPLRRMFTSDPEHVLVKTDLSQAQWRVCVWDAKITRFIERYANDPKFDIHKWLASKIYNILESNVLKQHRDVAKNGVYGGQFGMMARKAALIYGIPLHEAEMVLGVHRREIPEVPAWWLTVQRTLNNTRTLISPLGRVRTFHDRLDEPLYRDAYAHICQAVEADIIHRACVLGDLILPRCYPLMQIHDEIVFQCHESTLEENLPRIKNIMEYPIWFPGISEPLIIPAEISVGKNWLEQKKWSPK